MDHDFPQSTVRGNDLGKFNQRNQLQTGLELSASVLHMQLSQQTQIKLQEIANSFLWKKLVHYTQTPLSV
jgi:hypothetical protein